MYTLIAQNNRGEQLELTHNADYTIIDIDGLNPAGAIINLSNAADFDGARFNSSRVNVRNIVITAAINPPIETNRINLYKFFCPKKQVTLYFKNDVRDVYIAGYVETVEISLFTNLQKAQISILCANPYFMDKMASICNFESVVPLLEFPYSADPAGAPVSEISINDTKVVINNGDVQSGIIIKLKAIGLVRQPKIYNQDTAEFVGLNIEMQEGDIVTINTNKGEKSITLNTSGTEKNIINNLEKGSTWLQLESGDNLFLYTAQEYPENMICTFEYNNKYEGV